MKKFVFYLIVLVSLFCVYAADDTSGVRDVQSFEIQGIIPVINPSNNKQVYLYVRDMYDDSNRPVVQGDIINLGYAQELQDDFVHMFRVELLRNSFTTPVITINVKPFTKVTMDSNGVLTEATPKKELYTIVRSETKYEFSQGITKDVYGFKEFVEPPEDGHHESFGSDDRWEGTGKGINWYNDGEKPTNTPTGVSASSEDKFQAIGQEFIDYGTWERVGVFRGWNYKANDKTGWYDLTGENDYSDGMMTFYIDYFIKIISSEADEETMYKMDVTVTLDGE